MDNIFFISILNKGGQPPAHLLAFVAFQIDAGYSQNFLFEK
jgi:hypothetical protein